MRYDHITMRAIRLNEKLAFYPFLNPWEKESDRRTIPRQRSTRDIMLDYRQLHERNRELTAITHLRRELAIVRRLGKQHTP